ncbi:MAG: tetratricopeptide repeat protein [Candidatus Omnitrophota bacterium]
MKKHWRRKISFVLLAGIFLCPAVKISAGEKEELDEILRCDSELVQTIERNKTADFRAAVDGLIKKYQDFIRKYRRNADARNYLGGLYYDFGLPEKAFREWQTGLRIDPQNPYLHNNIAEYYGHDSGQPEKAVAEARTAVRLKPDAAVFHFNLATYYDVFRFAVRPGFKSLEEVFEESLKEYRKAVELDPANFEYASIYARTLTYGPKAWEIKDSHPVSEKVQAWEYCLTLAPDPQQKEFIRKELAKLAPD